MTSLKKFLAILVFIYLSIFAYPLCTYFVYLGSEREKERNPLGYRSVHGLERLDIIFLAVMFPHVYLWVYLSKYIVDNMLTNFRF